MKVVPLIVASGIVVKMSFVGIEILEFWIKSFGLLTFGLLMAVWLPWTVRYEVAPQQRKMIMKIIVGCCCLIFSVLIFNWPLRIAFAFSKSD